MSEQFDLFPKPAKPAKENFPWEDELPFASYACPDGCSLFGVACVGAHQCKDWFTDRCKKPEAQP